MSMFWHCISTGSISKALSEHLHVADAVVVVEDPSGHARQASVSDTVDLYWPFLQGLHSAGVFEVAFDIAKPAAHWHVCVLSSVVARAVFGWHSTMLTGVETATCVFQGRVSLSYLRVVSESRI